MQQHLTLPKPIFILLKLELHQSQQAMETG